MTAAASSAAAGVRDHLEAIDPLVEQRWFGRCAILHDAQGSPAEIYFWGYSGG